MISDTQKTKEPPATTPAAPIDRLVVIGHPGRIGGADTELDHQICCWQAMGITVHICPTEPLDANALAMRMDARGCVYHNPCDWPSIAGMHAISFCNGAFLANLEAIKRHVATATFVNCMTWTFDAEVAAQRRGLIDFHLYQTDHQAQRIGQTLGQLPGYRPLRFTPYFDCAEFPFIDHDDRDRSTFKFGRISRPDLDKFHARSVWIYETMVAPVSKEGVILGWDRRAQDKLGIAPDWIKTLPPCAMSQQAFYTFASVVIQSSDTFENLPRVGFEAMASGSVLVVDDRGGWRTQVEDGVTGWRCADEREFVYKASRAAFERAETAQMARTARTRLEERWGMTPAAASWNAIFKQWACAGAPSRQNVREPVLELC